VRGAASNGRPYREMTITSDELVRAGRAPHLMAPKTFVSTNSLRQTFWLNIRYMCHAAVAAVLLGIFELSGVVGAYRPYP
jgi:hypothetical protein